jgi:hypothetical protein
MQEGENGHNEYSWVENDCKESMTQFFFQLVRKANHLEPKLDSLIQSCKSSPYHLSLLYRMIGQTRDIIAGKGEYQLTYMMLYVWYKHYPELAKYALKSCVVSADDEEPPFGSWKDIKYFCKYCHERGNADEFIDYAIELLCDQITTDNVQFMLNGENAKISLAAKWSPRESSSFKFIYNKLVARFCKVKTLNLNNAHKKKFRQTISKLNKHLDTLQIKQCGNTWSAIDFHHVTSISMNKQKKAFLKETNEDRTQCAAHFKEHITNAVNGSGKEVKGKRIGMEQFTKEALSIINDPNSEPLLLDLLNSQWRDNSSQMASHLGNMVAMVDVSGSMEGDPIHAAIALGIRIAETSALGPQVLTFSQQPSWVRFQPEQPFVEKVRILKKANWGMSTNFYAALDLILGSMIQNGVSQDMVLVILSDMQMNQAFTENATLYQTIEMKYQQHGFQMPHLLFWNLRATSGFPTLSTQPNVSMMSGFSPALLNLFCEKGMDALTECTPWSQMVALLNHERYRDMEVFVEKKMD